MKKIYFIFLVYCLFLSGCNNEAPRTNYPSNQTQLQCEKVRAVVLDGDLKEPLEDGEVETIQTITESFLAFTEGIGGTTSDKALELFYQTEDDVEYQIWQNNHDGTATEIARDSIYGETFEAPELSSLYGFRKEDFKKISICLNGAQGWLDIEFFKDGQILASHPYFIRPAEAGKSVAFVVSTFTLDAYFRGVGGRSNYRNFEGYPGTYTRPKNYPYNYSFRIGPRTACEHWPRVDRLYLEYFANNDVDVEVIDDQSMTEWNLIKDYKTIIFGTHNEYWTPETFQNVKQFVDGGGNIVILGGNTAFRVFKQKKDYKVMLHQETTGAEYEIVHDYLGSFYTAQGFLTFAPYNKVADHELMQGVDASFGAVSTNNCADREDSVGDGASGWETDKKVNDTFITLAKGANPNGAGAELVFKEFPSGGKVINFGSLSLVGALDDPGVDRLLQNVMDEFGMR